MNTNLWLGRMFFPLFCFFVFTASQTDVLALTLGDEVEANTAVAVRQSPAGAISGAQSAGSQGFLGVGPLIATLDGTSYTWWYVKFSTPPSGWVADIGLTAIVPSAPTLNSPGSSLSPGMTLSNLSPTLSWNAVTGANGYGAYVYDITTGSLAYSNGSVGNVTSVTAGPLPMGNSFRWYAEASDSAGFSAPSAFLYFQTPALAPAAPTLNSPGASSSPGSTIANVHPALSWNAVVGAANYGVYVYDITSSTLVYGNDTVGNVTTLTLPTALTDGHDYRWNARASNSAGSSGYSPFLYFVEQLPSIAGFSLAPGSVNMNVLGLSNGWTVVLESSPDLTTWTPVQTNIATGTTLSLSTSVNTSLQAQFLRIVVQ